MNGDLQVGKIRLPRIVLRNKRRNILYFVSEKPKSFLTVSKSVPELSLVLLGSLGKQLLSHSTVYLCLVGSSTALWGTDCSAEQKQVLLDRM